MFQQDKLCFLAQRLHGQPVWHIHPAKELIEKDVKNKLHESMTPKYLWIACAEYQAFDLSIVGKNVFTEAAKQLIKAYWHLRRNKTVMDIHREQTKNLQD